MAAPVAPAQVETWIAQLRLLRQPFTTYTEVLDRIRNLLQRAYPAAKVLNVSFTADNPRELDANVPFRYVVGYSSELLRRVSAELYKESADSVFGLDQIGELRRRLDSEYRRGAGVVRQLYWAIEHECLDSVERWWKPQSVEELEGRNPVPIYAALLQLLYVDGVVGRFGVASIVDAVLDADGESAECLIEFAPDRADGDPPLPFVRTRCNPKSPECFSDYESQFASHGAADENRRLWSDDIAFKWLRTLQGLDPKNPAGSAQYSADVYRTIQRFGKRLGFLTISCDRSCGGEVWGNLGDRETEMFGGWLDAARHDGVRALALDCFRLKGTAMSDYGAHESDRPPDDLETTVSIWTNVLIQALGWKSADPRENVTGDLPWKPSAINERVSLHIGRLLRAPNSISGQTWLKPDQLSEGSERELTLALSGSGSVGEDDFVIAYSRSLDFCVGLLHDLLRKRLMLQSRFEARLAARQSAVVAIMGRNMSHNIGSHVLANLASEGSVGEYANDEIAQLNSYLRTRMDFIADIATANPGARMSANLFRDIVAPMQGLAADTVRFPGQKILLEFISGTRRGAKITMLTAQNGELTQWTPECPDVPCSIPGGVVGFHALYAILENAIRNRAKHGIDGEAGITIAHRPFDHPELTLIEISGGQVLDEQVVDINGLIREPIIDNVGKPNTAKRHWGFKEMKLCAAYLRNIAHADVDKPCYNAPSESDGIPILDGHESSQLVRERNGRLPPLLKAVRSVDGNLCYHLYLLKPKHVVLYDKFNLLRDLPSRESEGISYLCDQPTSSLAHDFVITVTDDNTPLSAKDFTDDLGRWPQRSMAAGAKWLQGKITQPEFVNLVWEAWVQSQHPNKILLLRVFEKNEQAATSWSAEAPAVKGYAGVYDALDAIGSGCRSDYLVYDRHGEMLTQQAIVKGDNTVYAYAPYWQPYAAAGVLEFPPITPAIRYRTVLELTEAAATGVIVVDERIQREADARSEKEIGATLREILSWQRIGLPPSEFDLYTWEPSADAQPANEWNQLTTKGKASLLLSWIESESRLRDASFLVIHLGILENLRRYLSMSLSDLQEECEKSGLTVITISGRGNPAEVKNVGGRFLHYSQISRSLLEGCSKYHLCKALFGARSIAE